MLCFDPRYLFNQVAVAKMLKDDKDHELESCSRLANLEVRRFHQQRLSEMKETLVQVRFSLAFNNRPIFLVRHSNWLNIIFRLATTNQMAIPVGG